MRPGTKMSEQSKRKISQTLKGREKSKTHVENVSKALKGRKLSEEHRKNLSTAHLGHKPSKATKERMSKAQEGSKNPLWKGGQYKSKGRIMVMMKTHPYARGGYIRKSRLVMEKMLGRYLKREEVVHHINKIVDDDSPDNLQLFPNQSIHAKFHYSTR